MNNLRTELWLRERPNQHRLTAQGAFSVASPKKLLGQDTKKNAPREAWGTTTFLGQPHGSKTPEEKNKDGQQECSV